jgi:hypothetical protein
VNLQKSKKQYHEDEPSIAEAQGKSKPQKSGQLGDPKQEAQRKTALISLCLSANLCVSLCSEAALIH